MPLSPGEFDFRWRGAMMRALTLALVGAAVEGGCGRLRAVCDGARGGIMPLSPGGFDFRWRGAVMRALAFKKDRSSYQKRQLGRNWVSAAALKK